MMERIETLDHLFEFFYSTIQYSDPSRIFIANTFLSLLPQEVKEKKPETLSIPNIITIFYLAKQAERGPLCSPTSNQDTVLGGISALKKERKEEFIKMVKAELSKEEYGDVKEDFFEKVKKGDEMKKEEKLKKLIDSYERRYIIRSEEDYSYDNNENNDENINNGDEYGDDDD